MNVELAEASAEGLVLVDGELLIAEEDHQVAHQCRMNFVELQRGERLPKIDAEDLRADGRGERFDADCCVVAAVVWHGVLDFMLHPGFAWITYSQRHSRLFGK